MNENRGIIYLLMALLTQLSLRLTVGSQNMKMMDHATQNAVLIVRESQSLAFILHRHLHLLLRLNFPKKYTISIFVANIDLNSKIFKIEIIKDF